MYTHNKFIQRIVVSFILIFTINSFLLVIPLISNNSVINNSDETDSIQQDFIFPAISAGINIKRSSKNINAIKINGSSPNCRGIFLLIHLFSKNQKI